MHQKDYSQQQHPNTQSAMEESNSNPPHKQLPMPSVQTLQQSPQSPKLFIFPSQQPQQEQQKLQQSLQSSF